MAEVTVRANVAVLGLARGDVITVERTDYIERVIASGFLSVAAVAPERIEYVDPGPVS